MGLITSVVLGSLVLPGLMTLAVQDKAKPSLISCSTLAAPFIEKTLSPSQVIPSATWQRTWLFLQNILTSQGSRSREGLPYKYRAPGGSASSADKLMRSSSYRRSLHFDCKYVCSFKNG